MDVSTPMNSFDKKWLFSEEEAEEEGGQVQTVRSKMHSASRKNSSTFSGASRPILPICPYKHQNNAKNRALRATGVVFFGALRAKNFPGFYFSKILPNVSARGKVDGGVLILSQW